MKNSAVALVAIVSLAAGALLHAVLPSSDRAPSIGAQQGPVFQPATGLESRIDLLGQRVDALSQRIANSETQSASDWKKALDLLTKLSGGKGSGGSTAAATNGSPAMPQAQESPEELRARWRESLDRTERAVLAADPAGWNSKDTATWSRLDELKKAREALDQAKDEDALRKLAESREFGVYFKLKKPSSSAPEPATFR